MISRGREDGEMNPQFRRFITYRLTEETREHLEEKQDDVKEKLFLLSLQRFLLAVMHSLVKLRSEETMS